MPHIPTTVIHLPWEEVPSAGACPGTPTHRDPAMNSEAPCSKWGGCNCDLGGDTTLWSGTSGMGWHQEQWQHHVGGMVQGLFLGEWGQDPARARGSHSCIWEEVTPLVRVGSKAVFVMLKARSISQQALPVHTCPESCGFAASPVQPKYTSVRWRCRAGGSWCWAEGSIILIGHR